MEVLGNGEGWTRKKLDVEDYLDLIDDRNLPLTVRQLREIISMHGFKKIEAPKGILKEMVATMELMDLHRSTLLDGVSGDACLTLKEVKDDLKSLKWQDCHVTSLLTYGAGSTSSSSTGDRTLKRKRQRRSGRKAVKLALDDSVVSTTGTTILAKSTTDWSGDSTSTET
ncbi:uncharacterized protein LOC131000653 [Salvia miltiorrhiza]|uniref:uncharacterized protein LOC131000653 n=1 Tax=Salvia miltiorrhiza TaxID=226208 RepID=UPI0025ACF11A|nr:uncharacterized protein LOC131000653 [Salvia miltiorrhiza]